MPPIHTPTSYLASLPDDVKRRVRLVHVAAKSVPRAKGLQLAREGPEHTIRIPVELPPLAQSVNALDLVSYVRFLQNLPLADARLLLQMGYVRTFGPGKPITVRHAGSKVISKHNEFFIIASGIVRVEVVGGAAAAAAAAAAATAGGARAGAASSGGGSGGGGGKGGAKGSSEAQELSYASHPSNSLRASMSMTNAIPPHTGMQPLVSTFPLACCACAPTATALRRHAPPSWWRRRRRRCSASCSTSWSFGTSWCTPAS